MFEDKLYSISDIAKITKLTDRTIRNYLANQTLKGRKVGGQWRFTKEDIKSLFSQNEFADDMLAKSEKNISKYVKQELTFESLNNGCFIINFVVKEKEKRIALFKKINELPEDNDKKEKVSFIETDGKIKMVLIASLDYLIKVTDLIKDVIV